MLDPNMEPVIDDEVDVAVVFDEEGKGEQDKEGFKNRDESDADEEEAGTGQVGERIGSAKSKADKDEDGTGTVKQHLRTVAKLARRRWSLVVAVNPQNLQIPRSTETNR